MPSVCLNRRYIILLTQIALNQSTIRQYTKNIIKRWLHNPGPVICFSLFCLGLYLSEPHFGYLQIGIRDGYLYILNGVAALVTFAFCRILIFPFLFWKYSSYLDISVTELPLRIPLICTLGSIILVCIFSYWLYKMSSMAKMELHWKSPHRTSRKNLISCR